MDGWMDGWMLDRWMLDDGCIYDVCMDVNDGWILDDGQMDMDMDRWLDVG